MATTLITSHATLKTVVNEWLNRTDLDDEIGTAIDHAEARFRRDPRLRDPSSNAVLTSLSAGTNWLVEDHPDIYLFGTLVEIVPIIKEDEPRLQRWEQKLELAIAQASAVRRDPNRSLDVDASYASFQTFVADVLDRSDLKNVIPELIVLAEAKFRRDPRLRDPSNNSVLAALSGSTNWLFTDHPDIYLYGTCLEAAPYLGDDPRIPVWKTLLDEAIAAVSEVRRDPNRTLAVDTYANLQTFVADVLNRSDLKNVIPTLIELAEAGFRKDPRVRDPANNASLPALTGIATTNWLLTSHPDIYVYGTCVEAEPYLEAGDPRIAIWRMRLEERIAGLAGSARLDPARTLALDSYANLQNMIADVLGRGDMETVIPVLISLAEARFKREPRLREMKTATFSITGDDISLPSDFKRLESWYHDGGTYYGPIEIVSADTLSELKAEQFGSASGAPSYAAIIVDQDDAPTVRFAPTPSSTFSTKMVYEATLGALSAGSNWLFTNHPDVYLYGALAEAGPYISDDPAKAAMVPGWEQRRELAIEEVHNQTWNAQFSGTMRRVISPIGG